MLHCTHFEIKQLLHAFLILSVVYYLPRSAVCLTRKVLYLVFEAGFTCSARHHSRQGVWWFYSLKCTGEQATGIFVGIVITHPEMKITYFLINFLFTSLSVMVGLSLSKLARPTIPAIAHYFGTKGRYEEVNPHLLDDILSVNRSLLVPPSPDCRAIHMVSVIRHGTRYPTTKNVKKIARLFDLVVSDASGSASWLNNIKTWKMWYTEDMDGRLVEKGRDDHRHLAMRLAQSFPTLISEDLLRANRIEFITSSKHRCIDSVEAFQEGLHRLWDVQGRLNVPS